jgi:hypothetical protein
MKGRKEERQREVVTELKYTSRHEYSWNITTQIHFSIVKSARYTVSQIYFILFWNNTLHAVCTVSDS